VKATAPKSLKIDGRTIGPGEPPYMIAELSGNHNGQIERAFELIQHAKNAGADAVKIQTYTADTITIESDRPEFRISGGLWDGRTLYELYKEAHTPWEWHEALFDKAREVGITMFSSPFDATAVDLLANLGAPAYKIASFELLDLPLIQKAAEQGRPLIMSTGLANLGEIGDAIDAAREAGCDDLAVLHCVSAYPAPANESNVRTIPHLAEAFGTPVGLSDHTLGTAVAVAAVAMGACVIEKHVCLRRADGGPDAGFSLEPHEFKQLVQDCRDASEALGRPHYDLKGSERGAVVFRRSLYAVADIAPGERFTAENVRSIRPGNGLPPKELPNLLGKVARCKVPRGTPLDWSFVD